MARLVLLYIVLHMYSYPVAGIVILPFSSFSSSPFLMFFFFSFFLKFSFSLSVQLEKGGARSEMK